MAMPPSNLSDAASAVRLTPQDTQPPDTQQDVPSQDVQPQDIQPQDIQTSAPHSLETGSPETKSQETEEKSATHSNSPTPKALAQRRQQLKAQRKFKFYATAWRALAMVALTVGTIRLATSPIWLIRDQQQIEVSGNQLLSDENVQSLIPLPYPQSLLSVQPEELAIALTKHDPIATAAVRRQLIPLGLHVQVSERKPVATTTPNIDRPIQSIPSEPVPFEEPGLIDAQGYWMPRNSFAELGATDAEPALIVRGMTSQQVSDWPPIYQTIASSPVSITEIDLTAPNNVILQSELGSVHLGPYRSSTAFSAQLTALDQLRRLADKVNPEKVAFIDLQDPDNPIVEILQATNDSPTR